MFILTQDTRNGNENKVSLGEPCSPSHPLLVGKQTALTAGTSQRGSSPVWSPTDKQSKAPSLSLHAQSLSPVLEQETVQES